MSDESALSEAQRREWRSVCASHDLPLRHVFHGQLWGQELAIWRADDGFVNVWQNRCLHRGVRLSIGTSDGAELKCAYHGWRYASRNAGCTYIPAHPADSPARTICNHVYRSTERHGLVWAALEPDGDLPEHDEIPDDAVVMRGIAVNAPVEVVNAALANTGSDAHYFLQPVDSNRTVIRGILLDPPDDTLAALRAADAKLSALRDRLEAEAATQPGAPPIKQVFHRVSANISALPVNTGRKPAHRVSVKHKAIAGADIFAFTLEPLERNLPSFQPGAHIDIHLPDGQIRQYSLINGPDETKTYTIAVKLEPEGRGGSRMMHTSVQEGDVLAISAPHNNFPLRRDAAQTLFIAGGIGATPLIGMAKTLNWSNLPFSFQAFARTRAHVPLADILDDLNATYHLGLGPGATKDRLSELLAAPDPEAHVYVCGPGPMMDVARDIAKQAGWTDQQVHFEYFGNTAEIDKSSPIEVALARSAITINVAAGQTILEALREGGVNLPSSCEQGACGTCRCTVIDGTPDHQDVYLSEHERVAGNQIMTCVSRAKSRRLVLDL